MDGEAASVLQDSVRAKAPVQLAVVEGSAAPTSLEELTRQMTSLRSAVLSWDGGDRDCSVYVTHTGSDGQLVARGNAGSKRIDWIQADRRYEFRLYAGHSNDGRPLATTTIEIPALPPRKQVELLRSSPVYAAAVRSELEAVDPASTDTELRDRLAADAAAAEVLGLTRRGPTPVQLLADHLVEPDRCLSLGCGTGELERHLLAEGIGRRFNGVDLNPDSIDEARRRAGEEGLEIDYSAADLNTLRLEPNRYDLVVADGCLSRVLALEHLVDQIWRTLKPAGLLWVRDYVGEQRFRPKEARLALANSVLRRLPTDLRRDAASSHKIESAVGPATEDLRPFDAVRSHDVQHALLDRFGRVGMDEYDAIFHLVCPVGMRAAFARSEEGREVLDDLLQLDRLLVRTGAMSGTSASMLFTKALIRPLDLDGISKRLRGEARVTADASFQADLNATLNQVRARLPGFDTLLPAQQSAVVTLAFDLDPAELARLDSLMDAVAERDWLRAEDELERLPVAQAGEQAGAVREQLTARSRRPAGILSGREYLPPAIPAKAYRPADDLCVISCLFNPCGYETKLRNAQALVEPMERGGVHWSLVECAFGSDRFLLPADPKIVQRRADSVLWQKERLLNVLVDQLPDRFTKIAWIDADVLFANQDWAAETSALLDEYALVQPYEYAVRLPKGARRSTGSTMFHPTDGRHIGENRHWRGFAASESDRPEGDFGRLHGHPGFAWAARRELLGSRTLYDRCIAGGGDQVIARASVGDWCSSAVMNLVGGVAPLLDDASAWAEGWYGDVRGRIGFVPGTILHLWHGMHEHRRYSLRGFALTALEFDPAVDLRVAENGCWEWASDKPDLHGWLARHFESRLEDG